MKETIKAFYTAFGNKDGEKMVSFYHDDIEFTDPAFGTLKGERAKNMWRMLTENATDLKVEVSDIDVDSHNGKAHWEAHYSFSQTGRNVHNKIDAEFIFKEGKIIKHVDSFNIHTWARQALGFKGLLLGGTSFFKRKFQAQTSHLLDKYEKKKLNG